MDEFMLSGSRPPSVSSFRPSSSASFHDRQHTQRDDIDSSRFSSRSGTNRHVDRLFSNQHGDKSNRPLSANRTGSSKTKVKNRHNPSFVDDTLFGPKPEEPSFTAPWGDRKEKKPLAFDGVDYRARRTYKSEIEDPYHEKNIQKTKKNMSQRPSSGQKSRPSSGKYRTKNQDPYVDETLFGERPKSPGFAAPWEDKDCVKQKPYLFDVTDYKIKSKKNTSHGYGQKMTANGYSNHQPDVHSYRNGIQNNSNHCQSSRSARSGVNSRPGTPKSKEPKKTHNPSFVDETLFGPKPVDPDFHAPWENPKDSKPRILAFDASNYKVKVSHDMTVTQKVKPGWKAQRPRTPDPSAKAIWK